MYSRTMGWFLLAANVGFCIWNAALGGANYVIASISGIAALVVAYSLGVTS